MRTRNFSIKRLLFNPDNVEEIMQLGKNKSNILFFVHAFDVFDKHFTSIIQSLPYPSIVCPTEFGSKQQMLEEFGQCGLTKFLICSDYALKYFTKQLKIPSNKIKLIYSSTHDELNCVTSSTSLNEKIIVTPSLLSSDKDFFSLLTAVKDLQANKYEDLKYLLLLKKHPRFDISNANQLLDKLQDFIETNCMENFTRIVLCNDDAKYRECLRRATIFLLPYDNSHALYSGTFIDTIVSGKTVIAPDMLRYTKEVVKENKKLIDTQKGFKTSDGQLEYLELGKQRHCYDFAKKEIGVLLYQNSSVETIITSCSIAFENNEIKTIMEKQNKEMGKQLTFSHAAPQLLSFIKKLK